MSPMVPYVFYSDVTADTYIVDLLCFICISHGYFVIDVALILLIFLFLLP